MIEKTIIDHLQNKLDTSNVYAERPEGINGSFVLVEKTGSRRANWIETATIAVQSYGNTLFEAATLNELVKTAMDSLVENDTVSSSRLQSDYNFSNTAKKEHRYQAVFEVTYH